MNAKKARGSALLAAVGLALSPVAVRAAESDQAAASAAQGFEAAFASARALSAQAADDGAKQKLLDSALRDAAGRDDVAEMRRLVKLGANPNAVSATEMTPLSLAVSGYDDPEAVEALIDLGADVNLRGLCGTALNDAAFSGHVGNAEVLLAHHAEIDSRGCQQQTPLMEAADWGHADVASYLLKNGADASAVDSSGKTALILAARIEVFDHLAAVKALLADPRTAVNARDQDGLTALKAAVKGDSLDFVKLLLAAPGIDVNDDAGGTSALFLAELNNYQDIAALLRQAGARDSAATAAR